MTDLKNLLEEAAGEEPAITDDTLAGYLRRGRRSARRRQLTGVVAGVAATALVIGGGWALLPDTKRASVEPDVAATPSATPSTRLPGKSRPTAGQMTSWPVPLPESTLPPVPAPDHPVELVPDGKVRAGTDLVCDLKPKGWQAKVYPSAAANESEMSYFDPKLPAGKYHEVTTSLRVRHARFYKEGNRMLVEKYSNTWEELKFRQRRAGDRWAVVSGSSQGPDIDANGLRDFHMRMSETKLIQVFNSATGLGWDLPTALRFVGSCHYAN
jgi:hypothetical protein